MDSLQSAVPASSHPSHPFRVSRLCLPAVASLCLGLSAHAQASGALPANSPARISVEYSFESRGRKAGQLDTVEWNVQRNASIVTTLKSRAASPYPALGPKDPAIAADTQRKQALAAKTQQQMQPMMQAAEQIMARCGDDDACVERESMKLGASINAKGGLSADEKAAGRNIAEISKLPEGSVQLFEGVSQQGSFRIRENVTILTADPICHDRPNKRCKREEQRVAEAALPQAPAGKGTASLAEVSHNGGTLTMILPMPLNALMVEQTIQTDHPEQARESGRSQVVSPWSFTGDTLTVKLKGDWRKQSGEQVSEVTDRAGLKGKLTVRWRFEAP
ncbi:hypothetical protein [Uliginosibacterium sp. H1]|uniref:hypothetical protein n=1 Tax=Uliginosibacterium sp. H1 TaxID=3114757 RepID=UPI002E186DEF|nr:hypothetical protein [Uliginosibacterium sp. H1]